MGRILRFSLPLLAVSFAVVPACTCSGPASGTAASASASAAAASAAALASASASAAPDEEVRPVYPPLTGPADPTAVKVCALVYTAAELRADACCNRKRGKSGLEKECERAVSGALSLGHVKIPAEKIAECEKAVDAAFADCDWVRSTGAPALPPACTALFDGTLSPRERCRSHLECKTGLFCEGLSPTQTGICSPPRLDGGCFGGSDSLSSLARQMPDQGHTACDGVCIGRRCSEPVALGAACKSSAECGKDNHCEGTCKKGPPNDCGACGYGTACVAGACRPFNKAGAACTENAECRGQCVKAAGAKTGTCAMQCDFVWPGRK